MVIITTKRGRGSQPSCPNGAALQPAIPCAPLSLNPRSVCPDRILSKSQNQQWVGELLCSRVAAKITPQSWPLENPPAPNPQGAPDDSPLHRHQHWTPNTGPCCSPEMRCGHCPPQSESPASLPLRPEVNPRSRACTWPPGSWELRSLAL